MGQYYRIVNVDRQEYLDPCLMGGGLKLPELMHGGHALTGLALLLSDPPSRYHHGAVVGSWAGDRIVICGDYIDESKYGFEGTLYSQCNTSAFTDISLNVMQALDSEE